MQHPIIDVPIESLPFVDEHFIEIAANSERGLGCADRGGRGLW